MRRTREEALATRTAIMEAALLEFAERGYAAATLADIATRAGLTRGAAYHHFEDKADLYLQAVGERWEEVGDTIWRHLDADGSPLARVRRFLVAYFVALESDRRLRTLLEVTMFKTESLPELEPGLRAKAGAMRDWTDRLSAVLVQAADRGELRAGVPPATAAFAISSYATGVTTLFLTDPDLLSPARNAEQLAATALGGLSA